MHGSDKQTTTQRLKGNAVVPDIAEFAETIMWKPAKTVQVDKDEERWRMDIWLGFLEHSGEYIIGTERGVVKCRAVRRLDEVGNFDAQRIGRIRGSPWQPVPGRLSMRIPTNIDSNGKVTNGNGEDDGHSEDAHEYNATFDSGIDSTQDADNPQSEVKRNTDPPVLDRNYASRSKYVNMSVRREML